MRSAPLCGMSSLRRAEAPIVAWRGRRAHYAPDETTSLEDRVPPMQCPNCGRFLKNALVESLAEGDQPCPGCEVALTADMFDADASASVRPPDLYPAEVRDDASDVLDGWDRGASAAEIASWAQDHRPFPTDTVAVAAGALGGVLFGAAVTRHRIRGGVLGGLVGAVVAAVIRQVWRLQD